MSTITDWDIVTGAQLKVYRRRPGAQDYLIIGWLVPVGSSIVAIPKRPKKNMGTFAIDDTAGYPRIKIIGLDGEHITCDIDLLAAITRGVIALGETSIDLHTLTTLITEGPRRQ